MCLPYIHLSVPDLRTPQVPPSLEATQQVRLGVTQEQRDTGAAMAGGPRSADQGSYPGCPAAARPVVTVPSLWGKGGRKTRRLCPRPTHALTITDERGESLNSHANNKVLLGQLFQQKSNDYSNFTPPTGLSTMKAILLIGQHRQLPGPLPAEVLV